MENEWPICDHTLQYALCELKPCHLLEVLKESHVIRLAIGDDLEGHLRSLEMLQFDSVKALITLPYITQVYHLLFVMYSVIHCHIIGLCWTYQRRHYLNY